MNDEFEICGTHIPFSKIKNYSVVQKEYIYRPAYKAKQNSIGKLLSNCKYEFYQMIPYAAIVSEDEYKLATKKAKGVTVENSIKQDVAVGLISTIADKLNIKELKYKKYKCINVAGRTFTTFLEDVPAVILREDGRVTDVYKNDELYKQLGDSISPSVLMIPTLSITADTEYLFYGNGIQLLDALAEYERLRNCLESYKIEQHNNKLINILPKMLIPQLFNKASQKNDAIALPENSDKDIN